MGKLIEMPTQNQAPTEVNFENSKSQATLVTSIDFSVWNSAPKERTAAYFPTYSAVSKAMQTAMRQWVREWFLANAEILQRPHAAYPILVFQCTHPFSGKPTNYFTYDIQQTETLNKAFASAANKLGRELKTLNTKGYTWLTREHYFAYRSKEVVKYVMKNRKAIYKMLNVETMLVDSILKFAVMDVPKLGLEESLVLLRRAFNTQLRRFSDQIELSNRSEELLQIATAALKTKLSEENIVELPPRKENLVQMLHRHDNISLTLAAA